METPAHNLRAVRYEPEERPRPILAFGLAFQAGMPIVAAIVLTPAIVVRAAGMADSYLSWSIFTALAISGVTTVLQARRVGYFGAGYTLFMGTSGTFIAVCVTALADGGPALLATLVVISSSFQFLFAARLSLLRRIFTPTVIGTVLMLIPATVMPVLYHVLQQVPAGAAPAAAPGKRRRHADCRRGGHVARRRRMASLGTRHRDHCGLRRCRSVRSLRHRTRGPKRRGSHSPSMAGPGLTSDSVPPPSGHYCRRSYW